MESEDQSVAQVPAQLLKSLVASVEALQKNNAELAAEVATLKHMSGDFHRFSQLPIEIRSIIWKLALTAPQTHLLTRTTVSYSQVNTVMSVCHEARLQGRKLCLPYFHFGCSETKFYINLDVDTVWLLERNICLENWRVFCPDCPTYPIFPKRPFDGEPRPCTHNLRLKRLVLNWDDWTDPYEGRRRDFLGDVDGSVTLLMACNGGPEELLIVVSGQNDIANAARDSSATFVRPRQYPKLRLGTRFEFEEQDDDMGIRAIRLESSWDVMGERLEKILDRHKKDRTESRRIETQGTAVL